MQPIEVYAVAMAGTIVAVAVRARLLTVGCWLERMSRSWMARNLMYRPLVHRHRWLGPWGAMSVLHQMLWLCVALLLTFYNVTEARSLEARAGLVSIINLAPFYLGPHLSFVADLLSISLSTAKSIHRGAWVTLSITIAIHIIAVKPEGSIFTLTDLIQLSGVITGLAFALLLILCLNPFRRYLYELFLRLHQLLAVVIWCALYRHVKSGDVVAEYCILGLAGLFGLSFFVQGLDILIRHSFFLRGFPRAHLQSVGDAVCITVVSYTTFRLHPGQFINLYLPGLGLRSLIQSHPFVVTSAERLQHGTRLELMVYPRGRWTQRLRLHARQQPYDTSMTRENLHTAFFSGPHGQIIPMDEYGVVLLIASGWGLMALIPHLQHLLSSFNDGTSKVRRLHLVWQLEAIETGAPARGLLNRALAEDTTDTLRVSVYHSRNQLDPEDRKPGHRLTFYEGQEELVKQRTSSGMFSSAFRSPKCRMLVAVSGDGDTRDRIRTAMVNFAANHVRLIELEYQM